MDATREQNTVSEIAAKYQLHPNQISQWKKQFLDNAGAAFDSGKDESKTEHDAELARLYEQIGKLQVANDFLKKNCHEVQPRAATCNGRPFGIAT